MLSRFGSEWSSLGKEDPTWNYPRSNKRNSDQKRVVIFTSDLDDDRGTCNGEKFAITKTVYRHLELQSRVTEATLLQKLASYLKKCFTVLSDLCLKTKRLHSLRLFEIYFILFLFLIYLVFRGLFHILETASHAENQNTITESVWLLLSWTVVKKLKIHSLELKVKIIEEYEMTYVQHTSSLQALECICQRKKCLSMGILLWINCYLSNMKK